MTGFSRATLARNRLSVIAGTPEHAVTAVTAVSAVVVVTRLARATLQ
jgi:hypothetical protein